MTMQWESLVFNLPEVMTYMYNIEVSCQQGVLEFVQLAKILMPFNNGLVIFIFVLCKLVEK